MNIRELIARLGALGGLQLAGQPGALREAAGPERDFKQLIELVRAALAAVIHANSPSGEDRWVNLVALYPDRAVVDIRGRKYQYGYSLSSAVEGAPEQVILGAPVEVVEQFAPVAAAPAPVPPDTVADVREARFAEAADGSIHVTLIRAGRSRNGNYYPDAVLREAAPLFEGVRVFAKSDAEHVQGKGKDVRNLIGGVYNVRFVEGALPDGGSLTGTFRPLNPADVVVTKMTEAIKRGMHDLLGLSIDAHANTKKRREGNATLREAVRFVKVNSVDLIVEPGAGGGLDRLTEAAAEPMKGNTMLRERLLEAIQKKDPQKYAAINTNMIGDVELIDLYEAVCGTPLPVDSGTSHMTEAAADNTPVTRGELQMLQLRGVAASRIAASTLPAPAKQRLNDQFQRAERFTEAEIDAAIKSEGEYLARFTESGAVRVPAFGAGSVQVGDRSLVMGDMLNAFFDPKHKDHRSVPSFRECYIEITGDRRVTGRIADMDVGRLRESLGSYMPMREAVDSGAFAAALGDSITRRMQAIYEGETELNGWRDVATVGTVNDFRTQERIRIGGYGNLPGVAEGAAYTALTTPGDDKATYAVTKRGGTESVTLEAIKNDDVNAIRRIPLELALAAKHTLYEFVFDFYAQNPTIYDGLALFDAAHNNLFTGALTAAEFAAHRLAMLQQTRAGSGKRHGTSPTVLLVPFELQETAYDLFVRNQNLDKTFVQSINPKVLPVSYWTDGDDWVTVADPNRLPVLEISFLDGKEEPELFVQDAPNVGSMFSNDVLTYKIRHIYGGAVLVDGFKGTTKAVVP